MTPCAGGSAPSYDYDDSYILNIGSQIPLRHNQRPNRVLVEQPRGTALDLNLRTLHVLDGNTRRSILVVVGVTRARVLAQTRAAAQTLSTRRRSSGYGNTLDASDYVWGSNSVAANHSILLLIANYLQPNAQLLDAALGNLHYLLGRNCFGLCWVTHLGTNPFLHPHHRPSIADQVQAPWPGLLSGGPNAQPADKVAQTLGKLPPMRMWLDDQMAPSLNEVAINWNAALVFLLAAAKALAR